MSQQATWISVNDETPINDMDSFNGEVIGLVAPFGDISRATPNFVHFDGEDWYDRGNRTCTVTHWIPINFEYLKGQQATKDRIVS